MSKTLVLAEKPSVGKEIARVLNCKHSAGGYMSGDKYIVTWAMGHLVTLCDPEHYDNRYKEWNMETLPIMPEKMELCVIPETAKQFGVVKNLLHNSEVSELVIATDAGREGELVARWILQKAGFSKPIKRLWISSQTDKAIKDGFNNLKKGSEYYSLYLSAKSRAEADWIVGFNATRALTCKYNAQLSAGRVQTPTLAMIVERENEIKNFTPKDYFNVISDLGGFNVTYIDAKRNSMLFDKNVAEKVSARTKVKTLKLVKLDSELKHTAPPMLYDLTELQRDANKMYGYSPKQTLAIMQRLYETHKALTYPRTDSRYLTDDILPTIKDRLKAVCLPEFSQFTNEINREGMTLSKLCFNDAKVTDHHAIIPTEQRVMLSALSNEEHRIYSMVVKRFLTCFYPKYHYRKITADFVNPEGDKFYATGREIIDFGWKTVYSSKDDVDDDEQILPTLEQGVEFAVKNVEIKALKTGAPSRYTEATLLSAMENPSKFIADKNMREYIGGGLGTPATRADIIEKLYSAFYIEKKGNTIYPTSKGIQLINIVPSDLRQPLLTAKWEMKLEAIHKGELKSDVFVNEIKNYTKSLVKTIADSENSYNHDNITNHICPECGKYMLAVNSKKGKLLVCQDRNCGWRENVVTETNLRCPECHKKMELRGDGEKKMYVCKCGFREKATVMHDKLKNSHVSRRDIQKYMSSQASEPTASPFALAMQKAMKGKEKL